ncbi:flavin reductase family protein [Streptomyces sp. NPDC003247]|uniref:flavin reductase family protein n=1 Tax=Streptomyces sp. NPDC003247 TaxID=3364677 RepID=UPI0036B1FBA9
MSPTDPASGFFKEFFGSFPTPVYVVTALGADGEPRGFTCNALTAVSASPPLLLVCVDRGAQTLPAIVSSGAFVVNVLDASGAAMSRLFAGKGRNKFARVPWRSADGAKGAPVLTDGVLAHAECLVERTVPAGDHVLFLARVAGGAAAVDREALLHRRGAYGSWAPGRLLDALDPVARGDT